MGQENKIEYAGDLLEEIQELDKMVYDMDNNLTQSTLTRSCTAVLTICCC